jgi:hypothetical protein
MKGKTVAVIPDCPQCQHSAVPEVEGKTLGVPELAERYGVPLGTVHQWNSKGTGPRYLRAGKYARYRMRDVLAWEESRLVNDPLDAA